MKQDQVLRDAIKAASVAIRKIKLFQQIVSQNQLEVICAEDFERLYQAQKALVSAEMICSEKLYSMTHPGVKQEELPF